MYGDSSQNMALICQPQNSLQDIAAALIPILVNQNECYLILKSDQVPCILPSVSFQFCQSCMH